MIGLYFAPTPNGHKITLFLEGVEFGYHLIRINLGEDGQFRPEFLRIPPSSKIPVIADHSPADGDEPLSPFESGAILLYLAERTGLFLSHETRERAATLQWLFWQMGRLGPVPEQNHHFNHIAPQTIPYIIERYQAETQCLYYALNKRLENSP